MCVYNINHLTYEQYQYRLQIKLCTANCNALYNIKGNKGNKSTLFDSILYSTLQYI